MLSMRRQHPDLDLHHVQPTSVFADIVELQSAQPPPGFLCGERLIERASRMGRQIIKNDTDTLAVGK
jgi:hypothetical protein